MAERMHASLLPQIELHEVVNELLSVEQREILLMHEQMVAEYITEALKGYPEGIPDQIYDEIQDAVTLSIPGALEAMSAWLEIHDLLLKDDKDWVL